MSDDRRRRSLGTLTPVPDPDLRTMARNINSIGSAVTRIDTSVRAIQEDVLPPVASDAKEARDGVLRLDGRVNALESLPPPSHECTETDRQARQDAAIGAGEAKVAHNSRLLWWLLGTLFVVGSSAIGFAMVTGASAARTAASLEAADATIGRHEGAIKALVEAQARDRETYLREIRALPVKVSETVQASSPPAEQIDDAADELPLWPSERRQLIQILERARAREKQPNGER